MIGLSGCAGRVLQIEKSEEILKVDEFDNRVEIKEGPAIEPIPEIVAQPIGTPEPSKGKKTTPLPPKRAKVSTQPRQPELEDSVGFDGRRPLVVPYRVGEKVTFNISYFNIVAGEIELGIKPFAVVNGKKSYHFEIIGKTNSFFSRIYAVDDRAVTYLDYETLVPHNLQISIKETKQLSETRTFFDWKKKRASYWKKKISKDKGEESKKIEWDLPNYSQNVISAIYYLRNFQFEPGKKLAFRVADEGKNIIFKGLVLRREVLKTDLGDLKTVVIKPEITVDGVFKPVGEILLWLTDDDRKLPVRIESKIKIGTIVAKLKSIEKGLESHY